MPGGTADDRDAITALLHEYAFRLDAGDLDGVVALFEHAALGSVDDPGRLRGSEQARTLYAPVVLASDGTPRTRHVITNVVVTVADDRRDATARSYFTVLQATDALALQPIIAGEYRDRFERVDGSWRFCERLFAPVLVGDLSHHLDGGWRPAVDGGA